MDILKIASETVERFNMINTDDRVLISLSGGPDSVFLTLFLCGLSEKSKIRLFAFHLDHLTRNGDSARDAEFVKSFCDNLSIPLFTEKVDSVKWCRERRMNFQEGARLLRKGFLDKYASEKQIDKIALAHNADDVAETFIINLLRGANLKGISSISPYSGKIIRPLIYIYKKDIVSYLDNNNISYCTDYTNLKKDYLRNKVRLLLIPFIEDNFRKDVKKKIIKIAQTAKEADEFIEKTSENIFRQMLSENDDADYKKAETPGFIKFKLDSILSLDEIIIKRIILSAIELLKGDKRDTSERKINSILSMIKKAKPAVMQINRNLKIALTGGYIYFYNESHTDLKKIIISQSGKYFLDKPIKESGINIFDNQDIEKLKSDETVFQKDIKGHNIRFEFRIGSYSDFDIEKFKSLPENEAVFDLSEISFPLKLKSWQPGDYFKPFGGKFSKKLHDFFIDIKLPKECRMLVPVISDTEKIIWVFPYRRSDDARIKVTSGKILYLKIFIF